jgi:DNA-binding GntR family transcriptional regulator
MTPERILEGTVAYVEAQTGRRARSTRDRISARLATAGERELLGLADPSAVLVTRHVVLDADTRPLEFVESVVPPGAWTVEQEYIVGV